LTCPPLIDDFNPPTSTQGSVDQPIALNRGPAADANKDVVWAVNTHHRTDMMERSIAPVKRPLAKQDIVTVPRTTRPGPGVDANQQPLDGRPKSVTTPPRLHRIVDGGHRCSHPSTALIRATRNFIGGPKPPSIMVRQRVIDVEKTRGDAFHLKGLEEAVGQSKIRGANEDASHRANLFNTVLNVRF